MLSLLKYLAPIAAAAQVASAQCSAKATKTVSNQADAAAIATCPTFTGSIAVGHGAPDSLSFDGSLQHIRGNFIINNATQLSSLSASSLAYVDGTFGMKGLTVLSALNMPALAVANIDWITLPSLQSFTFGSFENASTVYISDTSIQSLDDLNVKMANDININNNGILTSINWQLANCTGLLSISSNNRNGGLNTTLSNLSYVGNMEVRQVSALVVPKLYEVDGAFITTSNFFESFEAPNLTLARGVAVVNNPSLTSLSFPQLFDNEGALVVAGNGQLGGTIKFPKLETIRGALNFTGAFSGISIPKINLVAGASSVISNHGLGDTCQTWGSTGTLAQQGVIKVPNPVCYSTKSKGTTSGSSSSPSSSATSSGAAVALLDPTAIKYTGLLGLVAALFGIF